MGSGRDDALALAVLSTLDGASAEMLYAFAAGLELAEGDVGEFRMPVFYLAVDREMGASEPGFLTVLAMRGALKMAAVKGTLVSRLAASEEPFWKAAGDAIAVYAAERLREKRPS